MKRFIILCLVLSFALSFPSVDSDMFEHIMNEFESKPAHEQFKLWHMLFKKSYEPESDEGIKRSTIFKSNMDYIKKINSQKLGYTLSPTQFADLSVEEFTNTHLLSATKKQLKQEVEKHNTKSNFLSQDDDEFKLFARHLSEVNFDEVIDAEEANNIELDSNDWSSLFASVPVQQTCKSSWAFSVAGAIEAAYAISTKSNTVQSLSAQQLVDCDKFDNGCKGGFSALALNYAGKNGLMLDSAYPYTGVQGTCQYNAKSTLVKPKGYNFCITCKNGEALSYLKNGPYVTSIDAATQDFMLYKSGIIPSKNCKKVNFNVLAVQSTSTYIKLRTSLGANWGENGYLRVSIDQSTKSCHAEELAFQPKF